MNKKAIRFYFVKNIFNTSIGRFIFLPFYHAVAFLICNLIEWRFYGVKAWPRNSLVTGDIIPGLSDIDITVVAHENIKHIQYFLPDFLKGIKFIFPILGECNFYQKSDLKLMFEVGNYYELNRDPQLCRFSNLDIEKSYDVEIEKICYVLRQFRSDEDNLKKIPKLRKYKWDRIFKRIETKVAYDGINSVNKVIGDVLGSDYKKQENSLCLFPHEWIEKHWRDENLAEMILKIKDFDESKRLVCLGQIRWEICGILGQLIFLPNPQEMIYHFNHLEMIAEAAARDDNKQLKSAIGHIRQIIGTKYDQT